MDPIEREAYWSTFAAKMLTHINNYYRAFIPTEYDFTLFAPVSQIESELQRANGLSDLSPEVRSQAEAFIPYYNEKYGLRIPD